MSVTPVSRPGLFPAPIYAALNFLVIGVIGRLWLAAWLRVFPRAAAGVRWTLHDEFSAAPPHLRWRRAIAFFAQLPRFAADQAAAESDPTTQTGGEPPDDGPPTGPLATGWSPGRLLRDAGFAIAGIVAVIVALTTWINGLGAVADMFDANRVSGSDTGAIAVTLLYGVLPLALLYNRRRFAATPGWRAGAEERLPQRAGWWLASGAFGLLALGVYIAVFGQYLDAYDRTRVGIEISFGAAFGMAVIALIAAGPLAWVVRQRYWVGRSRPS